MDLLHEENMSGWRTEFEATHSLLFKNINDVFLRKNSNREINSGMESINGIYEGWNFNSGNYLFTTDTK